MTDQQSRPDEPTIRERLTAVEDGLRHFREIWTMGNNQIRDTLSQLKQHNERQDSDREKMEEMLLTKIAEIYALLWSGLKWGSGLLASTLLAIILKASGLF